MWWTSVLFHLLLATTSCHATTTDNAIWQQFFDEDHQLYYYYKPSTDETTWELPKDTPFTVPTSTTRATTRATPTTSATTTSATATTTTGYDDEEDDYDAFEESSEDDLGSDADENVIPDHQINVNYKMNGQVDNSARQALEEELAKMTLDGQTLEREQVNELMKKGGLLNAESLAKMGLKVIERLDEVWVNIKSKLKDSKNTDKCGTKAIPCKTIQQGIDRASQRSKVYVSGGYYAGRGNVNLRIDGRYLELFSKPVQKAIIDCGGRGIPLIDPLHSAGNTGIHDFQITNCNLQDPSGQALTGDVDSASIQLPSFRKVWDPQLRQFVPDPAQVARMQRLQTSSTRKSRTPSGKKRIRRNFFRV